MKRRGFTTESTHLSACHQSYNTTMKNEIATAKRMTRTAHKMYRRTHDLLGQVSCMRPSNSRVWRGDLINVATLTEAAANYQDARALYAQASSLRPTRQVMRLRKVASDNYDVAREVMECIMIRANENVRPY